MSIGGNQSLSSIRSITQLVGVALMPSQVQTAFPARCSTTAFMSGSLYMGDFREETPRGLFQYAGRWDRKVKTEKTDHSLVSDDFYTVFLGRFMGDKHHDPDPGRPESNLKQALIVSSAGYNPPRLLLYPWASRMQPNISCNKSSW